MVDEKQTPPPPAEPAPAAASPGTVWYDPFLNFFSSVHVAVVILILLATISIIGTVLQQENIGDVGDNLRLYQQFFGDAGRAQRAFEISEKIGFFNLYHTWYFYTLLLLLSTSLIVCSLRRLPQTWRIMARPKVELEESGFKASPNRRALTLRLPRAEAAAAVVAIAQNVYALDPQTVQAALQQVIGSDVFKKFKTSAKAIIEKIGQIGDFVTAWEVSGPYMQEKLAGYQIFDVSFDPEKPDDSAS